MKTNVDASSDEVKKSETTPYKEGFFSALFTAVAGGIGAYTLMKLGTPTPDPVTAATVAVVGAGVFTSGIALTIATENLLVGIIFGGGGGITGAKLFSAVGSVIAGASGELAGTALAGVALLLGTSAVVINAERERPEQDLSGMQVMSGLMLGAALSAALAFSTASIPGSSALQQNTPEKTDVQTVPAAPAP